MPPLVSISQRGDWGEQDKKPRTSACGGRGLADRDTWVAVARGGGGAGAPSGAGAAPTGSGTRAEQEGGNNGWRPLQGYRVPEPGRGGSGLEATNCNDEVPAQETNTIID